MQRNRLGKRLSWGMYGHGVTSAPGIHPSVRAQFGLCHAVFPQTYKSRPHTTSSRKQETPYDCVTPARRKMRFPAFPRRSLTQHTASGTKSRRCFQKCETVRVGVQHPDVHLAGRLCGPMRWSHVREKSKLDTRRL